MSKTSNTDLKMDDYLFSTGCAIEGLRVLIEGAVYLYAEETDPLSRLAMAHGEFRAAQILSTIGEALYLLQSHIRDMQATYIEELKRQIEAEPAP